MAETSEVATGKTPTKDVPPVPLEAPDPDEDDLDDLDGVLRTSSAIGRPS